MVTVASPVAVDVLPPSATTWFEVRSALRKMSVACAEEYGNVAITAITARNRGDVFMESSLSTANHTPLKHTTYLLLRLAQKQCVNYNVASGQRRRCKADRQRPERSSRIAADHAAAWSRSPGLLSGAQPRTPRCPARDLSGCFHGYEWLLRGDVTDCNGRYRAVARVDSRRSAAIPCVSPVGGRR